MVLSLFGASSHLSVQRITLTQTHTTLNFLSLPSFLFAYTPFHFNFLFLSPLPHTTAQVLIGQAASMYAGVTRAGEGGGKGASLPSHNLQERKDKNEHAGVLR